MLLERLHRRVHVRHAFVWCSVLLVLIFAVPRIGGPQTVSMNGLYDSLAILVLFPLIVAMGAGDGITGRRSLAACKFLGGISYPLYITHYPLIYIYTAWVTRDHMPARHGVAWGVALLGTAVAVAYACLKLYDEPVRAWLARRFLVRGA